MLGLDMLNVLIGLVTIYLVFALACTAIVRGRGKREHPSPVRAQLSHPGRLAPSAGAAVGASLLEDRFTADRTQTGSRATDKRKKEV